MFVAFGFIVAGLFFFAVPAFAQGLVPCDGITCQACHVMMLVDKIIHFLIRLAIPLAALLFMYAGYLLVTDGGGEGSSAAKRIFSDVFFGLVLALIGFLIVDMILKTLAARDFTGPGWNVLRCMPRVTDGTGLTFRDPMYTPTTPSEDGLVAANPGQTLRGSTSEGTYSQTEAQGVLADIGGFTIVSSRNCTALEAGCTSLEGIRQDTINQLVNFQQACGCQITITGGTEPGHSAGPDGHTQGYKIDIALAPNIDAYIQQNFRYSGLRPGDNAALYTDRYGNQYARESNHWDIQVRTVGRYN